MLFWVFSSLAEPVRYVSAVVQHHVDWYSCQSQVWLPAAVKANSQEAAAGVRNNDLLESWQPVKTRDSCRKDHLNTSVQAEVFIRRERGSRTKRSRGGVEKFLACRPQESILTRKNPSDSACHPGFTVDGQQPP